MFYANDLFDVDTRPCSDSRHVTAPYKSALYYNYHWRRNFQRLFTHRKPIPHCRPKPGMLVVIRSVASRPLLSGRISDTNRMVNISSSDFRAYVTVCSSESLANINQFFPVT